MPPSIFFIVFFFLLSASLVSAQSDGGVAPPLSEPTSTASDTSTVAEPPVPPRAATSAQAVSPLPISRATTTAPTSSLPRPIPGTAPTPTPKPTPPASVAPVQITPAPTISLPADESSDGGNTTMIVLAGLAAAGALGTIGYGVARARKTPDKKEEKKEGNRCFNIKKLLDEKLEELTDLRGQLESKAEEVGREKLRETVEGTHAGKALSAIELAEKAYNELKQLYEKCIAELHANARVIVIGPSLSGKTVLTKYLRSQHNNVPVEEMDERLTEKNNGVFPIDTEYKRKVLAPKIIQEMLDRKHTLFFTNTDYFTPDDLKIAREKGFKIIQLSLGLPELKKRNEHRTKTEAYEDQSQWLESMLRYQQEIKDKKLVDAVLDAHLPTERIASKLMGIIEE